MEALKAILETNNPKIEINHILVDGENMVAIDARILIVKKHNMDIQKPFLLINDKAKYIMNTEAIEFNMKASYVLASGYPPYKRIIPKLENMIDINSRFIKALYEISSKHGVMFDYVKNATTYKKLDKELPEIESYQYREKNLPVTLIAGNYTIVMMPFVL